jgi:hypothetical protein
VLDAAQQLGLTVLRTWAFNDGDGWNALQPQPGKACVQASALCPWLLCWLREHAACGGDRKGTSTLHWVGTAGRQRSLDSMLG